MGEVKLTYFEFRGRAETIRLIYKLAGKEFTDNRLSSEEWKKFKPSTPKGQLPVLEVDGKMMCESLAITRYAARETGLYGSNSWEAAVCDMVSDTVQQIYEAIIHNMFVATTDEEKAQGDKEIVTKLAELEKVVVMYKKGDFMLGDKPSLADICIYCIIECQEFLPKNDETSRPTVNDIGQRFAALPQIADWLKSRPVTDH